MDEVFALYDEAMTPEFIGQDVSARNILNKSKCMPPIEYDQNKQTKYYEIMRWTVNHLASVYLNEQNYETYFNLIREVKEIKNTNNTFLIKLTDKLISRLKKQHNMLNQLESICKELIEFCLNTNNISMKNKIEIRLAEIYYINALYSKALELCNKIIFDLKRYEDNLGLIHLQLLESQIYYATKGLSKAKAALTSVKTLITKVYIEPKLQAKIDLHAGIIAAHEKDFGLAYSYFFESFDVYNIQTQRRKEKALRAFTYMILSKLVGGQIEDINNIVIGKQGRNYYGKEVEALRSVEVAVKEKSIRLLKENIEKHKEYLQDPIILYHLNNLHDDLLEQNLIKIILPYSVVEIDFITQSIGLGYEEILSKLRQMILDKKINGILDQGKGSLILYEESEAHPYLDKTLETFKHLEKVVETLDKKVRATNI